MHQAQQGNHQAKEEVITHQERQEVNQEMVLLEEKAVLRNKIIYGKSHIA